MNRARLRHSLLLVLIAGATSVSLGYQVSSLYQPRPDCQEFFFFYKGFNAYKIITRQEWRTRIASNYLGSAIVRGTRAPDYSPTPATATRVGIWTAIWFFLTCLIFLLGSPEQAIALTFATFAGVLAGYSHVLPNISDRIYPWDMPALFGSTLLCFLAVRGHFKAMLFALPALIPFKESLVVHSLSFLFWDTKPRNYGKKAAAVAFAACVLVKGIIDLWTDNPVPLLTPTFRRLGYKEMRFLVNLDYLSGFYKNYTLCINSGMLFGLCLLPTATRQAKMLKSVAALFAAGIFFAGNMCEFRIFFEAIPMFLFCAFPIPAPAPKSRRAA